MGRGKLYGLGIGHDHYLPIALHKRMHTISALIHTSIALRSVCMDRCPTLLGPRTKSTATADQRQQAPTSGPEPVRIACRAIECWQSRVAPEMDVWTMLPSSKASSAQ